MTTAIKVHLLRDIKRELVCGELGIGVPLNTSILQRRMGASAIPIRECLIELASQGLINSIPGRGFFTRPLEVVELSNSLELLETLLLDWAKVVAASPRRQDRLRPLHSRWSAVQDWSAFEMSSSLEEMLVQSYREPHAGIGASLAHRCAYILKIGDDVVGSMSVSAAIGAAVSKMISGNAAKSQFEISRYLSKRRAELPVILDSISTNAAFIA